MNNEFVGLPGVVDGKSLYGPSVASVEEAIDALKSNRVASNDGGHGSVIVWLNDAGAYCCAFTRHYNPLDHQEFASGDDLKDWLDIWMPRCDLQPELWD